jgi:hypothetical protein
MVDFDNQVPAKLTDSQKQLIYVKTNIGGYFFDAVIKMEHNSTLKITSHPIQLRSNISDHAYIEPNTLTMDIMMSDVATSAIFNQFSDGSSRSVSAYNLLLTLQSNRQPLQIHTRLKTYQNMLIEQITAPDDVKTLYGLKATVRFKEIFVANVSQVKVSKQTQVTGKTNKGQQQPIEPQPTVLRKIEDGAK